MAISQIIDAEMGVAAAAAVELIEHDAIIGLGTGHTVAHLLPLLAARDRSHCCIATSEATERAAEQLGLMVRPFDEIERINIAIDGADQIAPDGWLVKGGGGAHTREKVVAAAAERFIVIASSDKLVTALRPPVPLELLPFGVRATRREIGDVRMRDAPPSPDGGLIADYHGELDDLRKLSMRLSVTPGVVGHGLFEPELVDEVIVGRNGTATRFLVGAGPIR